MSTIVTNAETPATEKYAHEFYALLVSRAKLEQIDAGSDIDAVLVYRGKLSEAFAELGLSQIYYTRIRKIFLKYDCVTYLQRGTKAYDSVLVLHHPPPGILAPEDLTDVPGDATLSAVAERVSTLEHKVKILEEWIKNLGGLNIVEFARSTENRLSKLEAKTGGKNVKTAKK